MIDINKAVTIRYKLMNHVFEILVESTEKTMDFRQGKLPIADVVVTTEIFTDIKKGLKANEHEMQKLFETNDKNEIIEKILRAGEVQLTSEYRNKLKEEKTLQIINLIHRNAIDPKTNLPHPPQRIKNAFEEAKINIDFNKPAESQVHEIVKKISSILPIKYEIRDLKIRIPPQYTGKSFAILKHYGKLVEESWENDGSLVVLLEIPAGLQNDMLNDLNNLTKGNIDLTVLRTK